MCSEETSMTMLSYVSMLCLRAVTFAFVLSCCWHVSLTEEYLCPPECSCALLPQRVNAIQVNCSVFSIRKDLIAFSSIPANHTTQLSILCTFQYTLSDIYPGAFSHLKDLEVLDIYSCNFKSLSRHAFTGLRSLRELRIVRYHRPYSLHLYDLDANLLKDLPLLEVAEFGNNNVVQFPAGFFCGLKHLAQINASSNLLSSLSDLGVNFSEDSEQHSCLHNLSVLDVSSNSISEISMSLNHRLPRLTELYMNNNSVSVLPSDAFTRAQLRALDLSHNSIRSIQAETFSAAYNMIYLNLAHNISHVEERAFCDLFDLQTLYMQKNDLTNHALSQGMTHNKSQLQILDISCNGLKLVDTVMFQDLTELQLLNLQKNFIRAIPPYTFQNLNKLILLKLSNNSIDRVTTHGLRGLTKLQYLYMDLNYISLLGDNLFQDTPNLKYLNLSSNRLKEIPTSLTFLTSVQVLDFSFNMISTISSEAFRNLRYLIGITLKHNRITSLPYYLFKYSPQLQIINFSQNNLSSIPHESFHGLHQLKIIVLEENLIDDISLLFTQLRSLTHIYMSRNYVSSIRSHHFPKNVEEIDFSRNKIQRIGLLTFYNLPNLRKVDLSYNLLSEELSEVDIKISPSLSIRPLLYLRGNVFTCNCHMLWMKSVNDYVKNNLMNIADLHLVLCRILPEWNAFKFLIDVRDEGFVCTFKTLCDHRFNPSTCSCCSNTSENSTCHCLHTCPIPCTCFHNHNQKRFVMDCSSKQLNRVPQTPSIITELLLTNNSLSRLKKEDFVTLQNLQILDASHNVITSIEPQVFAGLRDLTTILLTHNNITTLNQKMLNGSSSLLTLDIQHNDINGIESGTFQRNTLLRNLDLSNNKLNNVSLPQFLKENTLLQQLNLVHNPWHCSCTFGPQFQQWVTSHADIITDTIKLKCASASIEATDIRYKPRNISILENSTVQDNNSLDLFNMSLLLLDFQFCNTLKNITKQNNAVHSVYNQVALYWAVSMSVLFVLLIIATVLTLRCREYIKVYIFSRYGFRFGVPDHDDTKFFDAFISFCSDDDPLIVDELTHRLETEQPFYKLCIHHRDFLGGVDIAEAISEAVKLSRHTIILLSNAFLASEWCHYEFKAAHHNLLKDKANRVIVVLLEEVDNAKLSNELKLYLKTNTYLRWGERWFWQKLRYTMPYIKKQMKTKTDS